MSKEGDALNSEWGNPTDSPNGESEKRQGDAAVEDSSLHIQGPYADSEIAKLDARDNAVQQLRSIYHLVSVSESDTLYRYDAEAGFYRDDGEQFVREILEEHLGKYNSKNEANQILYRLKQRDTIGIDDFGSEELLCLQNGTLDVSTPSEPVLRDHQPDDLFARQWPVSYEPDAECPRFRKFITETVHDEDAAKLQEFVGYTVVHHWGLPFQKALLLLGPTDAGKSTLLNIVEELVGEENIANESFGNLATDEFSAAQLHRKLANIYADLDSKLVQNTGLFKSVTGNDKLSVSKKYQPKFSFRPTQKLLFAANDVPTIEDAHDAFYNRWLYVRFLREIPDCEQDKQLIQKLTRELPGILNWALEGYQRLMEQGSFTNERATDEKRSFWQAYSDSVERFVEEGPVELTPGAETPKDDIYGVYQVWSEEQDNPVKPKQTFSKKLKREYGIEDCYPTIDGDRVYCYRGIELNGDDRTNDDSSWGVEGME